MLNKSNFTLKEHLIALVAMKCSALRQLCTPLNCLLDRPLYVHCRDLGLVKPLPKATGILSSLLWNVASPLFMFSPSSQYPLAQALYFFSEYFILLCCFFTEAGQPRSTDSVQPQVAVPSGYQKWNKKHCCKFCQTMVIKMSTHLQRVSVLTI